MSQRKVKQPKRGARKRNPSKPKAPDQLEPFKIVGQLVGAVKNAKGEVVREQIMGDVVVYRPNFGKLNQIADDAAKELAEQEQLARETAAEMRS